MSGFAKFEFKYGFIIVVFEMVNRKFTPIRI